MSDLSNVSVDGKQLTWKELAEHQNGEINHYRALAGVLSDLDRCEHGRHEGDVCDGCGGPSQGNPVVQTDIVDWAANEFTRPRQIGFGIDGDPIVVPTRADKHDPKAWREGRR